MTLLICEDCGESARVTVEPYGGGKMAVYNCPKCGKVTKQTRKMSSKPEPI